VNNLMKKLAVCLILLGLLIFPLFAASETRSLSGQDTVFISKITPRTGSYIVPGVKTPYYLEVEYSLSSATQAYLDVAVYLIPLGDKGKGKIIAQLPRKAISPGAKSIVLTTPEMDFTPGMQGFKTITVASMKTLKGKELAYSNSENFILGKRRILKSRSSNFKDNLQILSIKPGEGSVVKVAQSNVFKFKLAYGLASRKISYLNLEFSELSQINTGMCWQIFCVPLALGDEILEVDVPVRLPANLAGKSMGIAVPYRIEPLGRSASFKIFKIYTLEK